jgi:transcriptional regulator with XRE-family HTH domain
MDNIENNSFAEKLDRLFKEKKKSDGTQYSPTEVLEATRGVLTRVYLWKLRKGQASNPSLKVIQALAGFFGVHPSYFFENDEMKGEPVKGSQQKDLEVALRSSGLDDDGQKAVLLMIESIKKSKSKR